METNMYKKMVLGMLLLVAAGISVNSSQVHAAKQEKDLAFLKEQDDLYALLNNKLKLALKPENLDEEQNKWLASLGVNSPESGKNSIINDAFNKLRNDREKYEEERSKIVVEWNGIRRIFLPGATIERVKSIFVEEANKNKSRLSILPDYSKDYMEVTVNGQAQCDGYGLMMGDSVKIQQTVAKVASGICKKAKSAWSALPDSEDVRGKLLGRDK